MQVYRIKTLLDVSLRHLKRFSETQCCSFLYGTLLVIRQKGESENRGNKEANHTKFSEKQTFRTP